jgi:hypothetical protein
MLSAKEIKKGDYILKCEYNHVFLLDEFGKWYRNKCTNECIYCKNTLVKDNYYLIKN